VDAGCVDASGCDDANPCTEDACGEDGRCRHQTLAAGSPCGSSVDDACTDPDTCDADGICQPNHAAGGTTCGEAPSECSAQDTCNGSGRCQPNDFVTGTDCGDAPGICSDQDTCDGSGTCQPNDFAPGTSCGQGAVECSAQDTCDGFGACQLNHLTDGQPCTGGLCSAGSCAVCASESRSAVFTTTWTTTAGSADFLSHGCSSCQDETDYVVSFTAPATATFRIDASSSIDDSVLSISDGICSATELTCNDDVSDGVLDSRVEVALTQGQTIAIVVAELCENAGTGTLTVSQL
jgi:hypothetical protein